MQIDVVVRGSWSGRAELRSYVELVVGMLVRRLLGRFEGFPLGYLPAPNFVGVFR